METRALDYLIPMGPETREKYDNTELFVGPAHHVDDTTNFPSVSSIINESKHKVGVYVPSENIAAFDKEWRDSMEKCFSANPKYKGELDDYLKSGLSNGRKLRIQVMVVSNFGTFSLK
jgi:hypothetical protein